MIDKDLQLVKRLSDEMLQISKLYRKTLETMFEDELIPANVREQYERLLVTELKRQGFV